MDREKMVDDLISGLGVPNPDWNADQYRQHCQVLASLLIARELAGIRELLALTVVDEAALR